MQSKTHYLPTAKGHSMAMRWRTHGGPLLCAYLASTQPRASIGTPAKRHSMAFRWRADSGPIVNPYWVDPYGMFAFKDVFAHSFIFL